MNKSNQAVTGTTDRGNALRVDKPTLVISATQGLEVTNQDAGFTLGEGQLAILSRATEYSIGPGAYEVFSFDGSKGAADFVPGDFAINTAEVARAAELLNRRIPLCTLNNSLLTLTPLRQDSTRLLTSTPLFKTDGFQVELSAIAPSEPRDSYDTLIIGAGPYGTSARIACEAAGIDSYWIGDHLSFWLRSVQPTPLRSARAATNIYTRRPGHTFLDFCDKYDLEREGKIQFWEFLAYYFDLLDSFGVFPANERAEEIHHNGKNWVIRLSGPAGDRLITARNVVNATGIGMHPNVPRFVSDLPGAVAGHVSRHAVGALPVNKEIAVIGGGQSAIEYAVEAADHNNVTLFAREPIIFRNLHEPSRVVYRLLASNCEKYLRLLPVFMKQLVLRYLLTGTCEPEMKARMHNRRLRVLEGRQINGARLDDGNGVIAELDSGTANFDLLIAATGYRYDIRNIAYLTSFLDTKRHITAGRFPRLNANAMLKSAPRGMYFAGYSCMHTIGFKSQFIGGTNVVVKRIVEDILGDR